MFQGIRKTIAMTQLLLIDEAVLEVSRDKLPFQNMKHQQIPILKGNAELRPDLTD